MYFPEYYNPGVLNWTRLAFMFLIALPYTIYELYLATKKAASETEKKQYYYFIFTLTIAFIIGFIPNFLVYNIQIDPLWGVGFAIIFVIPFTYGAIKYQLFNIQVIAKQAFYYSAGVMLVGGLIILLNYLNRLFENVYPGFPFWLIPLVSSILAVTVSIFIWNKLKQNELLKYEFVTTATHKFRTPLTHIKWAAENLSSSKTLSTEDRTQLEYIQGSNVKLVELTGLLMNVASSEGDDFEYNNQREDLSGVTEEVITSLSNQLSVKKMTINRNLQNGSFVKCDTSKIKFIIQTFIENAVHYTGTNPTITVSVYRNGKNIVCAVRDNGIGIPKAEVALLFSKFYRGHRARLADTEGMGIGLFVSKQIINRHSGKIWAESEGEGRGSTFAFSLPASN